MKALHIPGLVPARVPHAREYRRAAIVLMIATGFKLVGVVGAVSRSDALVAALLFGAPFFDSVFVVLAVHWRVETLGASLGAIVFLLDLAGAGVPVIPFANPGYTGGTGTLFVAMYVIYTLSFAAGVIGTLLLRRNARRAPEVDTP